MTQQPFTRVVETDFNIWKEKKMIGVLLIDKMEDYQ